MAHYFKKEIYLRKVTNFWNCRETCDMKTRKIEAKNKFSSRTSSICLSTWNASTSAENFLFLFENLYESISRELFAKIFVNSVASQYDFFQTF